MQTILVVDDNKTNLMAAKSALQDKFKVVPVTMGEQALKFLDANPCDLILLDIDMPGMDGFEVLKSVNLLPPEKRAPIIFLTANTDPATVTRCIKEGGLDVIEKPFIVEIMLARISHILELLELRKAAN